MNVLVTGAYGRCGTAIIDNLHQSSDYELTYLNRSDRPDDHRYGSFDTHVADVSDYNAIRPAFDGQDAVVHLAAYPYTDGDWSDVFEPNILGMYNVLEAARDAEVESFVFGSTNHVQGLYEAELAPDIYRREHPLLLDHTDPVRPDSFYGATKSFGEDIGRYYAEAMDWPRRFYALRICTVQSAAYDNPYGPAERRVEEGEITRGDAAYQQSVKRTKATWHSRRDFAHLIDCCLQDSDVTYGIFNGVSANDRRWFSIQNARERLGYQPQDNGETWNEPPTTEQRDTES
ncbi:NAD(P)-dependent oxidoreductase [Halomicroarcula sp. F13]|uniref:NAD(P)-dependent oxidoreductase n=1 Tax=Haloarcula rubra TaxID=2487747 RepID=A0AAW4PYM0_9EURY|nr:NAD(P)-dependent oxidoreductase [Halomicroarcula rubra]MBX0325297.1 NAD(P)-dependent oxidoreductase [Halomicroarcula rubra]